MGLEAWIHIDGFPFSSLMEVDLTVDQVNALDTPIRQSLYEGMINTITSVLPQDFIDINSISEGVPVSDLVKDEKN